MKKIMVEYDVWLAKALVHLDYSYRKVLGRDPVVADMNEEELETWEGLVSRFGRASDIFLSKVLRARVESQDPGFRGSFRDLLNLAEKLGYIEAVAPWMRVRELGNLVVHEYAGESLNAELRELASSVPLLLALRTSHP